MADNEQSVALHQYLNSIITNIPFGVVTIAQDLDVSMLNSHAVNLLGFKDDSPSEFVDEPYETLFSKVQELQEMFEEDILTSNERRFDLNKYEFNGKILNIKCRAMLQGTLFIIEDYTTQAKLESDLKHQADYDPLTNLLNRTQLEKRVRTFGERNAEKKLVGAIVFIDLDRFKPVNDLAGHTAGDELLKKVAEIMKSHIRERDTLARVGGDEFILLLENCPLRRCMTITESIRKEIDEYVFIWEEHTFSIGISAGISTVTSETNDICDAVNYADKACLIAKQEGRNRIHVADDKLKEEKGDKEDISWINIINKAIKDDEFILYAQEIHALAESSQNVSHYELLLRIKGADGEVLSPAAFMPAAERYELMNKIDMWVLENAFKALKEGTHYSINLSGQTMSTPDFSEFVIRLEKKYKIDPIQITFEITETMAIKFLKNTRHLIEVLRKRGYNFSLDDFGTGLSSYEYLKTMPVSYLKIDGFFIKEIAKDKVSRAMVKSINEIGHVMGIKTIAEFVENEDILNMLKDLEIDYAQGYFVHKPEPLRCNTTK